jgi:hypothetical protein
MGKLFGRRVNMTVSGIAVLYVGVNDYTSPKVSKQYWVTLD